MKVVGVVVLGVGLLVGIASIAFVALDAVSFGWHQSSSEQLGSFTATEVRVNAPCGSVRVDAAPPGASEVQVERHSSWTVSRATTTVTQSGGTLVIEAGCPGFPNTGSDEESISLLVPAGIVLDAASDSGDVTVAGVSGELSLRSDSGDVTVASVSGELSLRSDSGDVRATAIAPGSVTASSDSGDVSLTLSQPPTTLDASSDSGSVDVALPDGPTAYTVDAASDSGDATVEVRTTPVDGPPLRAVSDSGDVTVRYS